MGYRYGNVFVQHCRTLEYRVHEHRDPTHTDTMMYKYIIRVRGFVARSEGRFPGIGDSLSSAATLKAIQTALTTPRRSMSYSIANTVLLSVPTGLDAKLGPEPLPAVVTEVSSGLFMVECGCIVYLVECDEDCQDRRVRSPVVSLRWSQTESFDENWYSRLTTHGRLIVRSDLFQSADNFRPLATPPLLPDYVRTASRYTLAPDGLELEFHFEDEERDRLPPVPATKATGTYTVRSEKPGYRRVGQVSIHLEGQKGTSRKALMIRAIAMGYSKLHADGFLRFDDRLKPVPPIIWGDFSENLFEPSVTVNMQAMMSNITKAGFVVPPGPVDLADALRINPAALAGINLGLGFAFPAVAAFNTLRAIDRVIDPPAPAGGIFGAIVGGVGDAIARAAVEDPVPDAAAAAVPLAPAEAIDMLEMMKRLGRLDPIEFFPPPLAMPSVGMDTYGLSSNRKGIAPPDRKRITGLLTAAFLDPCLCVDNETGKPTTEAELRAGPNLPALDRNGAMVRPFAFVPAKIEIGVLTPDEIATPLLTDDAPYDTYELETTTRFDAGKVHMPGTGVGSDGDVSVVVTNHGGIMQLETSWVAARTGKPPVLPLFKSNNSNIVPLRGTVVAKDVVPSPDGASLVYMLAGFFIHAVIDPKKYEIVPGVAPFLDIVVQEGAKLGAGYWADQVYSQSTSEGQGAATGANPFITNGAVAGETPPDSTFIVQGDEAGDSSDNLYYTSPVQGGGSQAIDTTFFVTQPQLEQGTTVDVPPPEQDQTNYSGFYYTPPIRP